MLLCGLSVFGTSERIFTMYTRAFILRREIDYFAFHLLYLSFQKIDSDRLFIFAGEGSSTVPLDHAGLANGSITHNHYLQTKTEYNLRVSTFTDKKKTRIPEYHVDFAGKEGVGSNFSKNETLSTFVGCAQAASHFKYCQL